jgi:hypothetical protein
LATFNLAATLFAIWVAGQIADGVATDMIHTMKFLLLPTRKLEFLMRSFLLV